MFPPLKNLLKLVWLVVWGSSSATLGSDISMDQLLSPPDSSLISEPNQIATMSRSAAPGAEPAAFTPAHVELVPSPNSHTLPPEITAKILQHYYNETCKLGDNLSKMLPLLLCSKSLCDIALPLLYERIVLRSTKWDKTTFFECAPDGTSRTKQSTPAETVFRFLSEPNPRSYRHLRSLEISDDKLFKKGQHVMADSVVLSEFHRLCDALQVKLQRAAQEDGVPVEHLQARKGSLNLGERSEMTAYLAPILGFSSLTMDIGSTMTSNFPRELYHPRTRIPFNMTRPEPTNQPLKHIFLRWEGHQLEEFPVMLQPLRSAGYNITILFTFKMGSLGSYDTRYVYDLPYPLWRENHSGVITVLERILGLLDSALGVGVSVEGEELHWLCGASAAPKHPKLLLKGPPRCSGGGPCSAPQDVDVQMLIRSMTFDEPIADCITAWREHRRANPVERYQYGGPARRKYTYNPPEWETGHPRLELDPAPFPDEPS